MERIWKYHVSIEDGVTKLSMPKMARVIHVAMQGGLLKIWALLDPTEPESERVFEVYGTGHPIPERRIYVGTVVDDPFVWHVFELLSN